ncbi:hypothetical protein [Thermus tengchongensis]|uniref:Nucleic acid-binding protein n=1 Tax=Thermus tengchongensis TaxID=1214928 RepID=A0ABY2K7J5_9DEIN|nr:hypothetical protein [Thermus tengchongensis]TFU14539.1 hypothetical protein E0489_12075 [Thermus tengchongensis]
MTAVVDITDQPINQAVADNNIFALFVDSGNESLLFEIVGMVVGPPSVIDPDPQNQASEFNRLVPEIPQRATYLQRHGTLWISTTLTPQELQLIPKLSEKNKKLKNRLGDLEALALAKSRGYLLLTDDGGLRKAAVNCGVPVRGSCGLLQVAVAKSLLTCQQAEHIYNVVFTKELGLYTDLTFVCPPGTCQKKR